MMKILDSDDSHRRCKARFAALTVVTAGILMASCASLTPPEVPAAESDQVRGLMSNSASDTAPVAPPDSAAGSGSGAAPPPVAQVPLENKEASGSHFRADSLLDQTCDGEAQKPLQGEITYSDLVRLGPDRWIFLRDTKDCPEDKTPDLMNKYFGILTRDGGDPDGILTAAEVEFDLNQRPRDSDRRPSDLEAFCLIAPPPGADDPFEMIAVGSGGYEPAKRRRLFRIRFSRQLGRWHAEILGKAEYHYQIARQDGAPSGFQAEGMLCDSREDGKFDVILADRGTHGIKKGEETGGRGGGLLKLTVDFASSCKKDCALLAQSEYVEIVGPKCNGVAISKSATGEWRDIAALHRRGDREVWASAVFEGKVDSRDHYCSIVYQLCANRKCSDLFSGAAKRLVVGVEVPGKKIEGITEGSTAQLFAIASDEEEKGVINVGFPRPTGIAQHALITAQRTSDLARPVGKAINYPDPSKVLVVFDLDNTLLTMTQDLGSVAWYNWQNQINKGIWPKQTRMRVGAHTGELLKVQGILYALADMRPTQPDVRQRILDLNKEGVAAYVLTARGPEFLNATQRELADAVLDFSKAPECKGSLCNKRGVISKNHVGESVRVQLGDDALSVLKGPKKDGGPRIVNIDHGIMMVSGQNKGIMLRLLLKNLPSNPFDAVIFVDDELKNVIHVAEQALEIGGNTVVYHYTRLEDEVAAFFKDEKNPEIFPALNQRQATVTDAWEKIWKSVCSHHWMEWCRFPTN